MATPSSRRFTYDVFLSFRGEDTRYGFTGYLYKALCDGGVHTFMDDGKLQSGEEITPTLQKAIEESRIAIVVLSHNYASSSFCLDELATILHCQSKGLLVIPVFYKVDPSNVRHQKGSYEEALAKHQKRFKGQEEKLHKWKMALRQVADLSGYHFGDGYEYQYKFIGSIVERVSRVINRVPLHVADYPVGLPSQVLIVKKLLDDASDDVVHMIGIHGMGGLGKTTLALAVYNSIADDFDSSCFLQNVREESNKHGLKHLQTVLLSEILGEKDINLASWQEGASIIQQRLGRKKVLLILDDVDNREQLQAFAGRSDWFGPGSRVIITTRDEQLLKSHEIERTYEVKKLNENDSLQLLIWNAFKKKKVDPSYEDVLKRVITYASGLPLALQLIGSNLVGKSVEEWESAIEHYERIPNGEILNILKGWQWVKSEDAEDNLGSMVPSKVDDFWAKSCNLDDDFFSAGFMRLAHVRSLCLPFNNFKHLPECIKEFHNLNELNVSHCKHLEEIRGFPPKLETFNATNCISLTTTSLSMLLNKELHEARKTHTHFRFPGASIPKWFDLKSSGPSCSFWFRNRFPARVLSLLIVHMDKDKFCFIRPQVYINGKCHGSSGTYLLKEERMFEFDQTYLSDLLRYRNLFEQPLEKEWNHVEVTYDESFLNMSRNKVTIKATGIHVFKEESMEDIRFDDPYIMEDIVEEEEKEEEKEEGEEDSTMEDIQFDPYIMEDIMEEEGRRGKKGKQHHGIHSRFDDPYSNKKLDKDLNSSQSQNHLLRTIGFFTFKFFIGLFLFLFALLFFTLFTSLSTNPRYEWDISIILLLLLLLLLL